MKLLSCAALGLAVALAPSHVAVFAFRGVWGDEQDNVDDDYDEINIEIRRYLQKNGTEAKNKTVYRLGGTITASYETSLDEAALCVAVQDVTEAALEEVLKADRAEVIKCAGAPRRTLQTGLMQARKRALAAVAIAHTYISEFASLEAAKAGAQIANGASFADDFAEALTDQIAADGLTSTVSAPTLAGASAEEPVKEIGGTVANETTTVAPAGSAQPSPSSRASGMMQANVPKVLLLAASSMVLASNTNRNRLRIGIG